MTVRSTERARTDKHTRLSKCIRTSATAVQYFAISMTFIVLAIPLKIYAEPHEANISIKTHRYCTGKVILLRAHTMPLFHLPESQSTILYKRKYLPGRQTSRWHPSKWRRNLVTVLFLSLCLSWSADKLEEGRSTTRRKESTQRRRHQRLTISRYPRSTTIVSVARSFRSVPRRSAKTVVASRRYKLDYPPWSQFLLRLLFLFFIFEIRPIFSMHSVGTKGTAASCPRLVTRFFMRLVARISSKCDSELGRGEIDFPAAHRRNGRPWIDVDEYWRRNNRPRRLGALLFCFMFDRNAISATIYWPIENFHEESNGLKVEVEDVASTYCWTRW